MDLSQLMQGGGAGMMMGPMDVTVNDTAETVHISSLALLKMLKHGTCEPLRRCGRCGLIMSSVVLPLPRAQVALACPWKSWA